MNIAKQLCGYTMTEADSFRRCIGKKKLKEMKAQESKFKKGWTDNGHSRDKVNTLWDSLLNFADYAFCMGHSIWMEYYKNSIEIIC